MQEPQRRIVGPLGVVDREEQGSPLGDIEGQPVQAVDGGERVGRRRAQRVCGDVRVGGIDRGAAPDEVLRRRGRAGEELIGVGRSVVDHGIEQPQRDAERIQPLQLARPGAQDPQPDRGGLLDGDREQRRLADPGLAFDDEEPARPLLGGADGCLELADGRRPLEQRLPGRSCQNGTKDPQTLGWAPQCPSPHRRAL